MFLWSIVAFLVTLGVLVTFHEFGHYLAARWAGVTVERFSVGFGKVLLSKTDKRGCEWTVSAIPLGGYVKMLSCDKESGSPDDEGAYENHPIWHRVVITCAGPAFNFLLSFLAFTLMFTIGIKRPVALIEHTVPNTPAAAAHIETNSQILQVNNKQAPTWHQVVLNLLPSLGKQTAASLLLHNRTTGADVSVSLDLHSLSLANGDKSLMQAVGFVPFTPKIPPVIARVLADSPASVAGLVADETIVKVNDEPIDSWRALRERVNASKGARLKMTVQTSRGVTKAINITPRAKRLKHKTVYMLGIESTRIKWPDAYLHNERYPLWQSLRLSASRTLELTKLSYWMIGQLVTGNLHYSAISGPVGIAEQAGVEARVGLSYFLGFLALISISMGIINLLPIPMLDGGQLIFLLIEKLRGGKPMSLDMQLRLMQLGAFLILSLMVFAVYNDVVRLFSL